MQTKLSHHVTVKFKKLWPCKIRKMQKKLSHYVTVKFYKNSPCQMQKSVSLCGCEIWRRRKSAPKNWLCLTFTVWNAKICLTVWLCLTFTMWNANCLIVHMTVNLTVWMWNCSLSPLAISILLSATINHGSGWFAQFCSRLLMLFIIISGNCYWLEFQDFESGCYWHLFLLVDQGSEMEQ